MAKPRRGAIGFQTDALHCKAKRLWGRLKEWRAVATRYEKTAGSFTGVLCLAATLEWLKS